MKLVVRCLYIKCGIQINLITAGRMVEFGFQQFHRSRATTAFQRYISNRHNVTYCLVDSEDNSVSQDIYLLIAMIKTDLYWCQKTPGKRRVSLYRVLYKLRKKTPASQCSLLHRSTHS